MTYLLGPNGAGKTTVMIDCRQPNPIPITINGAPLRAHTATSNARSASLSAAARYPKHTARQHLRWQARLAGIGVDDVESVLAEGLESRRHGWSGISPSGCCSASGSRRRCWPTLKTLVLDEPANGLDVEGILWLRELSRDRLPVARRSSSSALQPRRGRGHRVVDLHHGPRHGSLER